jgi:hypothetical protein
MRQNIWVLYNIKEERFLWDAISTRRGETIQTASINHWPEKYSNKEDRDMGWKYLYRKGWRVIKFTVPVRCDIENVPFQIVYDGEL